MAQLQAGMVGSLLLQVQLHPLLATAASNLMLFSVSCIERMSFRHDPSPSVVSCQTWEIGERVRASNEGLSVPSACPLNHLYLPASLRSDILQSSLRDCLATLEFSHHQPVVWGPSSIQHPDRKNEPRDGDIPPVYS